MNELINKNRGLYIFESIVFILLGILAIALPGLFTYSMEILIGFLFFVGGLVQGFRAFKASQGKAFWGALLTATISVVLGVLLLVYPITGIIALTLLIAAFFFVEGAVQIFVGFSMRDLQGWFWMVFSGLISIILAMLIWSDFPGSARWVIGLLVGINMLIAGLSQLILISTIKAK